MKRALGDLTTFLQSAQDSDFLAVELANFKPNFTFGIGGMQTSADLDISLEGGGWYEIRVWRLVLLLLSVSY